MVKLVEDYTLAEIIGEGSFSKVYRATHSKKSNLYAIKVISMQTMASNPKLEECMNNQTAALGQIGLQQHIVRHHQMLRTKNNSYYVYEYCNGGTLMDKIKKQKTLSETAALAIFQQLLSAFKVLNKHSIMHRDVKPENVLFHDGKAKLADFGFCKGLKPEENMTKTMLGSPIYMAPQVLKGESYTTKADIWSLGVILFEMLYGICPFQSNSIATLISTLNSSKSIDFPSTPHVTEQTKSLIRRMITKQDFRRIGWIELFSICGSQECSTRDSFPSEKNFEPYYYNPFKTAVTASSGKKEPLNSHSVEYWKEVSSFDRFLTDYSININRKPISLNRLQDRRKPLSSIIDSIPVMRPLTALNHKASDTTPLNERKTHKYKSYQHNSFIQNQPYNESAQIATKRETMLTIHQECMEALFKGLKMLEKQRNADSLVCCYLILRKVLQTLKKISLGIKLTEFQLLDLSTLVNSETLQVDRQLIQIRPQLLKLYRTLPQQLTPAIKDRVPLSLIQFLQQ